MPQSFCKPLFLTLWLFVSILALSISARAQDVQDRDQPYPAYIDLIGKPGSSRDLGEANIFFPLAQNNHHLFFLNLHGQRDNNDSREFNIGLGIRRMFARYILGGYGFFDLRISDHDNRFYQATFGGELLSDAIDLRANGYIPVTRQRPIMTTTAIGRPDLFKVASSNTERALYGFDGEIGLGLNRFLLGRVAPRFSNNLDWRFHLGGYHFFGARGAPRVLGGRGRLELSIFKNRESGWVPMGTELTLGLEGQYDRPRGGQIFGLFRLRLPVHKGLEQRLSHLQRRMTSPLGRDVD